VAKKLQSIEIFPGENGGHRVVTTSNARWARRAAQWPVGSTWSGPNLRSTCLARAKLKPFRRSAVISSGKRPLDLSRR